MAGLLDFVLGSGGRSPVGVAKATQQPEMPVEDRLRAGLASVGGSKGLIPALFNGITAFNSGQRTDPAGIELARKAAGENQTEKALVAKGVDPQIAAAAKTNPDLLKALISQTFGRQQIQNLGNGYIYKDGQVVQAYDNKSGGGTEYSLNPIYGTDDSGNPVLGTIGKDGSFKRIDTGGVKLQSGVDKVDLGTQWQIRDKRTGMVIGYEPKNLAAVEQEKVEGEAKGKAVASAPADIQSGQNALDYLGKIEKHPGLDWGTGIWSAKNFIPGTSGYDFENLVSQAKSGAFLTAIQQMRGMGSLSDAEGKTATAATNRMNTATTKEGFLDALADYRKVIQQGMDRAKRNLRTPAQAPAQGSGTPSVDDLLKKYGS